jgi:hypothetical protein
VRIAQTNIQLYNQLRDAHLPIDDLVLVHRAYELLASLYPGFYQADGKPFVAHGVGVTSILAWLDQPADILAVGLLHNVYGNADFGDGRRTGTTRFRRRVVRDAVGERVEGLLNRFADLRIHAQGIDAVRRDLGGRDDIERRLLIVDLADHLEKYIDLGVLYFGDNDWVVGRSDQVGGDLIELANALDQPKLGEMLSTAFAEASARAGDVPAELRAGDGRRYLELVVPRSCRRRLRVKVRDYAQHARLRFRLTARLRRLRSSAGDRMRRQPAPRA